MNWLNTLTGSRIRIRTPGEETDERVTVIEYVEPPHTPPPVYTRHEFVEVFCILDGTLSFQFLNESRFDLAAGANVTCPPWKPHSFWNETDESVTALLVCTPAGLDSFFRDSDRLLQKWSNRDTHSESIHLAMKNLRAQYGLEHVGGSPTAR